MSASAFNMSDPAQAQAAQAAMAAQLEAVKNFNIEAFTLLGIAIVATLLRTYARVSTVGFANLQPDDYLVWVGAIFHGIETGLAYMVGETAHGLANNGMTDAQRAGLDPNNPEYYLRVVGSKIQVAGWSSYSVLLWSLKAAMCCFFLRLTAGLEGYRLRIYVGFGLIAASWLTVVLNLLLSCHPLYKMWQIFPDPGVYCHPAISPALLWTFLSMNVFTDLYLISIPLPMLWKANMPKLKKVALICLFCCGLFVTLAAILRVVFIVTDLQNGALLAGSWAVRETFVAVITTNLPMLFPLFKRWLRPLVGGVASSLAKGSGGKRHTDGSSKPPTLETFGQKAVRARAPRSANHITNMSTFNESEERMVELRQLGPGLGGGVAGDGKGGVSDSASEEERCPGIQKTVDVSVLEEARGEMGRGNYTSTSPRSGRPTRTTYFADHIQSDAYRF